MKWMKTNFPSFVRALLFYTLFVILWGAWVRISHSGDGCGDHWPKCQGEFIPSATSGKTWIEYAHRFMSGLYGIVVFALSALSFRIFPNGHAARRWALISTVFTISEALLGAKLVLSGLVAGNDSPMRLFTMGLHLMNSLCLVASITIWDLKASEFQLETGVTTNGALKNVIRQGLGMCTLALGLICLIVLTGSIASLSTTLFPSESLLSGFINDFASDSHYLVRWRALHPALGVLLGLSIAGIGFFIQNSNVGPSLQLRARNLAWTFVAAVIVGTITLMSLSPVPLKLAHLTLTYWCWISLVRFFASLRLAHSQSKN